MKISEATLTKYFSKFCGDWLDNFARNNYQYCKKLGTETITRLKTIYREKEWGGDREAYSYIYIMLMLAKAYDDVLILVELTKDKQWPNDHKKTERIWDVLWDAKDRFDWFNCYCLDLELTKDLIKKLDELESNFYDLYGRGLYFSPELLVKRYSCNVCGFNIKSCNHIIGQIYNGASCRQIAEDVSVETVSIVNSPHDMRCRIWPWNVNEDWTIEGRIMNLNSIHDFIKDDSFQ